MQSRLGLPLEEREGLQRKEGREGMYNREEVRGVSKFATFGTKFFWKLLHTSKFWRCGDKEMCLIYL